MDKIDKKDKKILSILNMNGRASVSEISRKTGIPRDSVYYRLQRMMKMKYIRFFHVVMDPVKLGYPIYTFVNFVLHNFDEKSEEKFYSYLEDHPNIVYVTKTTGKWDCTIAVAARNLEHFDEILKEIRRQFSHVIKDFDTASIIKEIKYDSMINLID